MAIADSSTVGLEERARLEYEAAEARLMHDVDIRELTEIGRCSLETERLFKVLFSLNVQADQGLMSTGHRTYGARWRDHEGHTAWWLCVIEVCQDCGVEIATPVHGRRHLALPEAFANLGRVLQERDARGRVTCPVASYRDCDLRARKRAGR